MGAEVTEYIDLVERRVDILEALEGEALELRTVVDRLGASRSTVNRAVRNLEAAGLVEESQGTYTLTTLGQMGLDHYRSYRDRWADLADAAAVVNELPTDATVDLGVIADGEPVVPPREAPYRPIQRIQETIEEGYRYRAVLPALPDPRGVRLLYEHVMTDDNPAELVVSEDLYAELTGSFPRRLPAMVDTGNFELLVGDTPAFGVVITDSDEGSTVTLVVFGESGTVNGVVRNDSEAAVEWAESLYARRRESAQPVTGLSQETTDGGAQVRRGGATLTPDAPIPPLLERQGFVRLDRSYLLEREVADPARAWRAGLDLAEVHTGYAAERAGPDGVALADRLSDALADGDDCVLVGPPGSGKSTTAKRVACEWYDDRGPVFYREGGRGTTFEAVGELVATVERSEGTALVVVEDAVRREASDVLEALDRLADREDVSFLLDARESEWQDPAEEASAVDESVLRVEHMPSLAEDGYERVVEQFERTAGVDIDVPVADLRESVRSDSPVAGTGDTAPGEVLLLLHRLSGYADPLADRPTDFEEAVEDTYDRLADTGRGALDVGVLVNLLNVAGVDVTPGHVYALTVGERPEDAPVDEETVGSALAVLDDEALFGVRDGTYRTVHEAWSTTFLATLLDRAGERDARTRVRRVLSSLFGLADDAGLRERVRRAVDDPEPVDRIGGDPSGWADESLERVFEVARERPKLAALLGDADGPAVELPAARESTDTGELSAWLGWAFFNAGEYDRAESLFEGLSTDDSRLQRDRLLGLAAVAERRDEYDAAAESARECLSMARDAGDRRDEARARKRLGDVAIRRSENDRGRDHYEAALVAAREAGDRRSEAECLRAVGDAAHRQGEYDRARNCYERSLEIRRETGDRHGRAKTLKNLGALAFDRGEWTDAAEYGRRCLELCRETGDRAHEASALNNLGGIALRRSEYDRARRYYRESLEIKRDLGDRSGVATTLANLGVIEHEQGNPTASDEYLEEAIEINRELGNRKRVAHALNSLGNNALSRGVYDDAIELYERALSINRDIGDRRSASQNLHNIGGVASRRGNYERALEYYEESLAAWREMDASRQTGTVLTDIGRVAVERGELDRAAECFEEALGIFRELDSPGDEAECRLGLARLERKRGSYDRCETQVTEAIALSESVDEPTRRAEAQLERARLALATDDPERARDAARTAHEVFEAREMRHWVARARLLLGRAAAAESEYTRAREHWESVLETFEAVGSLAEAVTTLRELVGVADRTGVDGEQVRQWCERAAGYFDDLPPTHDDHRAWFREHCP